MARVLLLLLAAHAAAWWPGHRPPFPHPPRAGHDPTYPFDPRIHNFGNVGLGGRLHAAVAPWATSLITQRAYRGVEVRELMHAMLPSTPCVDFGCGTGLSTRAGDVGVDTSHEMLHVARSLAAGSSKTFVHGNAETWGNASQFASSTLSFVCHEMPQRARRRALWNAMRVSRESVLVMDIDPSYTPSLLMASGEPYVHDYLRQIDRDCAVLARLTGSRLVRHSLIPGHVVCWQFLPPSARRTIR